MSVPGTVSTVVANNPIEESLEPEMAVETDKYQPPNLEVQQEQTENEEVPEEEVEIENMYNKQQSVNPSKQTETYAEEEEDQENTAPDFVNSQMPYQYSPYMNPNIPSYPVQTTAQPFTPFNYYTTPPPPSTVESSTVVNKPSKKKPSNHRHSANSSKKPSPHESNRQNDYFVQRPNADNYFDGHSSLPVQPLRKDKPIEMTNSNPISNVEKETFMNYLNPYSTGHNHPNQANPIGENGYFPQNAPSNQFNPYLFNNQYSSGVPNYMNGYGPMPNYLNQPNFNGRNDFPSPYVQQNGQFNSYNNPFYGKNTNAFPYQNNVDNSYPYPFPNHRAFGNRFSPHLANSH